MGRCAALATNMACELLTVGQMAQADALTIEAGTPGFTLMQAAGRAVAQAIVQRWSPRATVVLCGPGNNGGDGLVAAAELLQQGWPVRVAMLAEPERLAGDARLAWAHWQARCVACAPGQTLSALLDEASLDGQALVVDALFGAGLTRPLDGMAARVLAKAQRKGLPIVAVDVPSGVWGDSGVSSGAVHCDVTVTFFRLKPAHLLMPARQLCGERVLADIGVHAYSLACFVSSLVGGRLAVPAAALLTCVVVARAVREPPAGRLVRVAWPAVLPPVAPVGPVTRASHDVEVDVVLPEDGQQFLGRRGGDLPRGRAALVALLVARDRSEGRLVGHDPRGQRDLGLGGDVLGGAHGDLLVWCACSPIHRTPCVVVTGWLRRRRRRPRG